MRDLLTDPLWRAEDLGHAVPGAEHAVSVCLPLWEHVIGYEENDPAVVGRFACGYPRFFLHPRVRELFAVAAENFARPGETALVFPTAAAASRAAEHVRKKSGAACRIEAFGHHALAALVLPESAREPAWKRWQHGGEIVGSRQAEAALSGAEGAGEAGVAARETVRRHLAELYGQPAGNVFLFASGMAAISAVQRLLAPGSPAAAAGIRETQQDRRGRLILGDIVVSVDGDDVAEPNDVYRVLDRHEVGDTVQVGIVRGDQRLEVPIALAGVAAQ